MQQAAVGRAQPHRHHALVLRRAIDERLQAARVLLRQRLDDGLGNRVRHQLAAGVEVAREPAQGEPVHHGQREVRGRDKSQKQGNQETELETKGFHGRAKTSPDGHFFPHSKRRSQRAARVRALRRTESSRLWRATEP